jgi:ATP-dependent helicase HrpA
VPADLPIHEHRDEVLAALRDHQVVVVAGETGSGKSTQLPQLCIELGRQSIAHTQPRRVAARSIAERVAEETGTVLGDLVGYTVRFTDRASKATRVRLMTDGILLAEIQRDRLLRRYDTIIVDEAHERSLNVDFLLGYLRELLPQRPDLRVIVTSATIDTARFAEHFGGAPIIEVSGRTHPVELRYRPIGDDRDEVDAVCDAVEELTHEGDGDILVFLSGEREIRDAADAVRRLDLRHTEVLPLYARLSSVDQHRVFEPHTGRRVILATNVAETSLTVPGVRYVVDPGTARISRYNRRTKVQRLPIEPISQASANQRAGRCGRVAPGICIRLYDEDDFLARPEFTEPEILRTNLASVILQMAAIGLGDIAAFPFVEPPDARSINDGVALLEELGALVDGRLTSLGRRLARLPLDPRLGRMVLEAERHGCVAEVLVIASALSIQDPRERPTGKEQAAAEAHARFADPSSDFLSIVALWQHLREARDARSSNQFRKLCKAEYLHYLRVREWQDLHAQLRQVVRGMGIRTDAHGELDPHALHRALLAGLLSHLGMRIEETRDYLGARQARFVLAGGSPLAKKPPKWVMAADLVETNRVWARTVARIQPEWAEQLGAHLVKRSYGEPWWDERRGAATCHERVTLYGLPVVTARPVPFARVDPVGARDLLIQHALIDGDLLPENRKVLEEVQALEDRLRRRDVYVGDEALFAFYDDRLPADVTTVRAYERWRRDHRDELTLTLADLIGPDIDVDGYPEVWHQGDLALALHYEFDPTSELDGVTVDIPLAALDEMHAVGFDWQVPGLRHDVVAALLRSLPKAVRRQFVPAGEHATALLERHGPGDGPVARVVSRHVGAEVRHDDLPDHLRMTFRVIDRDGRALAWSKDLEALREHLQVKFRRLATRAARPVEQAGLTSWSIGTLPRTGAVDVDGHRATAYPALVAEGDTVAVRVLPTEAEQREAMWIGTRRLLLLTAGSPTRALQQRLRKATRSALALSPYSSFAEVLVDCIGAALDELLVEHGGPAWDEAGYQRLHEAARTEVVDRTLQIADRVAEVLTDAHRVAGRLATLTAPALQPAATDVQVQVARLIHPGFVRASGTGRLPHLRRYLAAAEHRLETLPGDVARDRARLAEVARVEALAATSPARPEVRWLVEELRVSLFAQHLGTDGPVSEQRILRALQAS